MASEVSTEESAPTEDVHGGGDIQSAHHGHPPVSVTGRNAQCHLFPSSALQQIYTQHDPATLAIARPFASERHMSPSLPALGRIPHHSCFCWAGLSLRCLLNQRASLFTTCSWTATPPCPGSAPSQSPSPAEWGSASWSLFGT